MQPRVSHSAAPPADHAPLVLRNPTSPATWFLLAGLGLLVATIYLTVRTAQRTARTEERGDRLAELLLDVGQAIAPIDWQSGWQRQHLLARLLTTALARDVFVQDLELDPARSQDEFVCRNKHYTIVLRPSPHTDSHTTTAAGTGVGDDALEAMAWPNETSSPGHAVFFYPGDAEAAYSRNLQYAYADRDVEARPLPGRAHRRDDATRRLWDYRGFDDERWLLRDRPRNGDPTLAAGSATER